MASETKRISWAHAFFLIAGALLIIYYLLTEGIPSVSGGNFFESVVGVIEFVVGIFTLIVVIGFYCYYLFSPQEKIGAIKAIAPALIIFTLFGRYNMTLGNAEANSIISGLSEIAFVLIVLCGFTYIFLRKKILGTVFSYAALVYAVFIAVSYFVIMIMNAIDGSFDVKFMFASICIFMAVALLGVGGLRSCRSKAWLD